MADNNSVKALPSDLGTIRIADDVVSIIAGLAATDIKGVANMSGGFAGGISEALGRKNLSRGVKVEVGQEETSIDLSIVVEYGYLIPDVAQQIQQNVKKLVESMTGLRVVQVNINVQGINYPGAREEGK